MNRGTHSFRTGGELRLGRDGATLHHWERPTYNFQHILDFIDDEAFGENRAVDPANGQSTNAYGKYITNEWAVFFQDNWKARPNLTFNLGLRYDNFGNPEQGPDPLQRDHSRAGQHAAGADRERKRRQGRPAVRDRLEQLRPAARHHVGSIVDRTVGCPRGLRHVVQPDQQHRVQRRAAQPAAVRAGVQLGPGRHADRVLAGPGLRAESGARTRPRRARRHSRRPRRAARGRSAARDARILELVLRRAVSASVELRGRGELQRHAGQEADERRRADVRGLQPVLGRPARRHAQSTQSQLRGGRPQREPHRLELPGRQRAGAAALHERPRVPDGVHVRPVEGRAVSAMDVGNLALDYGYAATTSRTRWR